MRICANDLPIVTIWEIQTIEKSATYVLSMSPPGSIPTAPTDHPICSE